MYRKSQQLYEKARKYIPGGVNSPARAFQAVGGNPLFMDHGKGSRIYDVDGNGYLDYVGSWGPLILGHCHPEVMAALRGVLETGTSFGASTEKEVELAELIHQAFPSVEKVRLTNSGTEASMAALRLARAFTGRPMILKFEGCYHGHGDSLLVKAGSGVATLGLPDSPGVPSELARLTLTCPFNRLAAVGGSVFPAQGQDCSRDPGTGGWEYGLCPAAARLPGRTARHHPAERRPADFRRSDDRVSHRLRRSPGALWSPAGSDHPGQGHRGRPSGRGLRRSGRDHEPAGPNRTRLSGRHPLGKPSGGDRGDHNP